MTRPVDPPRRILYIIRRTAVDFAVPLFTNVQLARRFVEALSRKSITDLQIKSWKEYR